MYNLQTHRNTNNTVSLPNLKRAAAATRLVTSVASANRPFVSKQQILHRKRLVRNIDGAHLECNKITPFTYESEQRDVQNTFHKETAVEHSRAEEKLKLLASSDDTYLDMSQASIRKLDCFIKEAPISLS
ncbi:hypothetical protein Y1Q_0013952 [Alligator mississippiensis]|uniref:Uncharacterized protein n=1 Tax=Alligator mississippiensis TaxID=8496 RepID=A0A151P5Z4_ALLMI|nr:hypothetical protein Y1Q_0013952 [Alligator mississippiensis]